MNISRRGGVRSEVTDATPRVSLIAAMASALGVSALARAFLVQLVDAPGGVTVIALRPTPGWNLVESLPSEAFDARGYIVLILGNECGVAGEDLLHANGHAVWILLIATVLLVLARAASD